VTGLKREPVSSTGIKVRFPYLSKAVRKNAGARKNIGSLGEVATHTYPCPPHLRPCHLHRHCPASSLLPQGGEGRKNISSFAIFKTLLQQ